MFSKSQRWFFLFLVYFVTGMSACKSDAHTRLKLAHALDTTHPVHKAMDFMANKVMKDSDGQIEISIYPSQQLGTERECLELLQIGIVDITKVSAAVMEGIVPEFAVLSLPYIFKNREQYFRVLDGPVGEQLLLAGNAYWLQGLCYYDAGSRSFYSRDKLIQKPEDLAGLKIRVMLSNTAMRMIRYLGGSATPISWGELYTALQGGVVDAAENNPPSFYLSRHYEVCKYYALDEHASIPDVLVIGTRTWDRLGGYEQKIIKEAALESAIFQRKLWADSEERTLEELKKAGVEISYPDKEPFMKMVQPMYESYQNDPKMYDLIQSIRNTD